jgi:ABC-type transport system substrate-binding protein
MTDYFRTYRKMKFFFTRLLPACSGRIHFAVLSTGLILALCLFMLSGCAATESAGASDTSLISGAAAPDSQTPPAAAGTGETSSRGPSGPLRIWWEPHSQLNPLTDTTWTGQAVFTLVFRSLFRLNASWQLEPDLVSDYSYSSDRLELTLVLKPQIQFHDGSPLTSADVLACLNEIQRLGNASPYASALSAYAGGRATSATTLILQLARPDPAFLYALTFPVMKTGDLASPSDNRLQGTGFWRMERFSQGELLLKKVGEDSATTDALTEIVVKPYASATLAMRALEDDALDLVCLPPEDLCLYQARSNLRLDRFASRQFAALTLGSQHLKETNSIPYKYFFRAARWFASDNLWSGRAADLPIPAFHACFAGQAFSLEEFWPKVLAVSGPAADRTGIEAADASLALPLCAQPLRIIAPASQAVLGLMARQAAQWLDEAGQKSEVVILPDSQYQTDVAAGQYDLAFSIMDIPLSGEPGWYFTDPVAVTAPATEGLPEPQANRYDKSENLLQLGWPFFTFLGSSQPQTADEQVALASQYRQILVDQLLLSRRIGLMIRDAALAYGDRVIGQCQPTQSQPYQGVEDIWIWSGSSS